MIHKQIILKAIEKAEKKGYELPKFINRDWIAKGYSHVIPDDYVIYQIIFDHKFAKAFFGEEYTTGDIIFAGQKEYEKQLQIIVLEEDKIRYLEKFL